MTSKTDVTRFKRGQVWVCDDPFASIKLNTRSHIMAKRRPYVIMTSNEIIKKGDIEVIQAYPITSTADSNIAPSVEHDIVFRNSQGVWNRIVTNQLTPLDLAVFDKYIFTIPDDIMAKLDQITSYKLGLTSTFNDMSKTIEELSRSLENLKNNYSSKDEDTSVSRIITIDENLKPVEEQKEPEVLHKSPRVRWTAIIAKKFITLYKNKDYEGIYQLCGKMTDKQIVTRYYYLCNKFGGGGTTLRH